MRKTGLLISICITLILSLVSCYEQPVSDGDNVYDNPFDMDCPAYEPGVLIATFSPGDGDEDVSPDAEIIITFNRPVKNTGWSVNILSGGEYTSALNDSQTVLTITPSSFWEEGSEITVYLAGFVSADIHQLELEDSFSFSVAVTPALSFSTAGGTYDHDIDVGISCSGNSADVEIFYTIDGSDPDSSSTSEEYNGSPISVTGNGTVVTIKAIAINGILKSDVQSATYTIDYGDITAPQIESIIPDDGSVDISVNSSISITFNEPMLVSSVTCNTLDTYPYGSVRLSKADDNFNTCLIMLDDPIVSNENRTFQFTPAENLEYETTYKIMITTDVQDASGNNFEDEFIADAGFTTKSEPVYVTDVQIDSFPANMCEESDNSGSPCSATVYFSDGTQNANAFVTWSEDSPYASVDSNGIITSYSVTTDKSFILTASYTYGDVTETDNRSIVINNKYASSLTIDGHSEIDEGDSEDYDAYVVYGPSCCNCGEVEVSPSWSDNSSYVTVNSSGNVTASAVSSDRTFTLTASYTYDGDTVTDTKSITIEDCEISISFNCSKDTYISEELPDHDASTSVLLIQNVSSSEAHALLYFDITDITEDSLVKSAVLRIYPYIINNLSYARIYRITESWSDSVTWNAGGPDYTSYEYICSSPSDENQYWYIDVDEFVQNWVNQGSRNNYGFYMDAYSGYAIFYPSESSYYHPVLQVTYSIEP